MPATTYQFIDTNSDFDTFYTLNQHVSWLAFDTEFVGERRFFTLLCLIQVATEHGFYLIDPLAVSNVSKLGDLMVNPNIMKITHAGENDYKILFNDWGIVPKNIFDTQIAAGFLGYGYPISFVKIVEAELGLTLDKTSVVTDWEARPFKKNQLEYALNDVLHLPQLYKNLSTKLTQNGRLEWAKSEMKRWETAEYYIRDPHEEALGNTMMNNVKLHKQVFLLRLYEWRRETAKAQNVSKESVFPAKIISPVVKGIDNKQSLFDNRTIPDKVIRTHWDTLRALYEPSPTNEEREILKRIPPPVKETPQQELSMELLHVLVKYRCMEFGIAPTLVLNKSDLRYAQKGEDIFEKANDWKKDFLGEDLILWLNQRKEISVTMQGKSFVVTM